MDTKKRNGFASGIGFILAAAGSAVGLGNLWSFPYKTSVNGGSAFVFVYIISVLVLGCFVMIAEIYLGKRAAANPITAYKKAHSSLGWLGLFAIIIPFLIISYYSVLGGYTIKFAVNSFNNNSEILGTFSVNFWEVILFTGIFTCIALLIVMGGIKSGIEKASKILMPILFLVLVAVVIYCLTLGEGVKEGLEYYLKPDFSKLTFDTILAAMGQAFYSLSLGMGIMVSYGSYAGQELKIGKSVLMICLFDTLIAFLCGLAVFPAIYHYSAVAGTEVSTKGVVLLFSSFPLVFDSLGIIGKIVSLFFFGMVSIAAITSVISLFEVVTQFVIQKYKVRRKKAIFVIAIACFLLSIPIAISLGFEITSTSANPNNMTIFGLNWLDFFDSVVNVVLLPICAFGSCLSIGWFIEKNSRMKDRLNPSNLANCLIEDGLNLGKFQKVFAVMVKYISPFLILLIFVGGLKDTIFPAGEFSVNGLGLVLVAVAIMCVSLFVYFKFLINKDTGCNEDELILNEVAKNDAAMDNNTNNK